MDNILEYAQIFQKELDHQMQAKATTGWMEVNSDLIQYNGGNQIKIASIVMNGLANYNRTKGFPEGSINLSFETNNFTQDRARTFSLDSMDVDETNFVMSAANVMGTFQTDYVIPEVEAYRYSKIAKLAQEAEHFSTGYTPAETTIWKKLNDDIAAIQDEIGEDKELVITMSIKTGKILNANDRIGKNLDVTTFTKGEIQTKVQAIDGNPVIKVPSALFYTDYDFLTGEADENAGGFKKTEAAKPINWIITARVSPVAVSKTEKIRIFEPYQNIKADAWKIDYRKYHDLWIPKNKMKGVFVNIGG